MDKNDFDSFFKIHSKNVDNANSLGFWELTDQIIKTYLLENITKRQNVTIVDFGGGTGRWALLLDSYFIDSQFIIIDLSKDMLHQAKIKVEKGLYNNKVKLIKSDISDIRQMENESADYIISTYNPLSFVEEPNKIINEAYRILKNGGKALITVQGFYNALSSKVNNYLAESEELKQIYAEKKVRWNPSVPKLWQLSKMSMEEMFKVSGFVGVSSRGISCIAQPQSEDFDPENIKVGTLSAKLNTDKSFFKTLLKLELAIGSDQDAIDRGMNIMTIGSK